MSDDSAAAAGGVPEAPQISVVDTSAAGTSLINEGSTALSKALLDTLKHQVESSTAEAAVLEKANHIVATQYSELKDNLGEIDSFYEAYQQHVAALKPQLEQIDALEVIVSKLEESARTLDAQTGQLESAIADVLS